MTSYHSPLTSLHRRQQILYVMIFTFATVVIWVGISLITSQQKSQISPQLKALALPLNPTLSRPTLDILQQKRVFRPDQLHGFPIYRLVTAPDGKQSVTTSRPSDIVTPPSSSPTATLIPSPIPEVVN